MARGVDRTTEARAFLEHAGWGKGQLSPLPGDASTRHYARVSLNGRRAMLMDQPQSAEEPPCPADATPAERTALGYNAVARLAGADCARFVAAAGFLRRRGLSAPEILDADTQNGFVLMEDLGDIRYDDALAGGADPLELYGDAIDALVRLQIDPAPHSLAPDRPLYSYDETALIAEIDLMTQWYVPVALGRTAREEEVEEHRSHWRAVLRKVRADSPVFVHRDFHAQNLMWLPNREGAARAGVVDFQDAVAGARGYDLVSLVEDARRDVAPEMAAAVTARHLAALRAHGVAIDPDAYRAEIAVMAAQRNTKIAGIFARLYRRDGKPRYLDYLPRVWGYLNRDLDHPALASLKQWYDRTIPREARGTPRAMAGTP